MDVRVENEEGVICTTCNLPLEPIGTHVDYLSGAFTAQLLRCPKCGVTYIDQKLVEEKVHQVEETLEGK